MRKKARIFSTILVLCIILGTQPVVSAYNSSVEPEMSIYEVFPDVQATAIAFKTATSEDRVFPLSFDPQSAIAHSQTKTVSGIEYTVEFFSDGSYRLITKTTQLISEMRGVTANSTSLGWTLYGGTLLSPEAWMKIKVYYTVNTSTNTASITSVVNDGNQNGTYFIGPDEIQVWCALNSYKESSSRAYRQASFERFISGNSTTYQVFNFYVKVQGNQIVKE